MRHPLPALLLAAVTGAVCAWGYVAWHPALVGRAAAQIINQPLTPRGGGVPWAYVGHICPGYNSDGRLCITVALPAGMTLVDTWVTPSDPATGQAIYSVLVNVRPKP